jgi:uncharacterized membrane protein YozB (DUF420 family)
MSGHDLPLVNACLNGTAAVLLLCGFAAIRAGRVRLHMSLMLTALATSLVFLASYLYYHFAVRGGMATRYIGEWREVYLAVLLSHTVLAAITAVLAPLTAGLALAGRFAAHKRIARWTLPIWLYVSVTGVVIYLILRDSYPKS